MDDFISSISSASSASRREKKKSLADEEGFDFKKRKPSAKKTTDFESLLPSVNTSSVSLESAKFLPEETDNDQIELNYDSKTSNSAEDSEKIEELNEAPFLANGVQFTEAHTSLVSSMAIDASKSRIATGSQDSSIFLYDFGGMSADFPYFKKIEPYSIDGGIYTITSLDWHPSNQVNLLCVCSSGNVPKIYTRDGGLKLTCAKGDPYIQDRLKTMGHVAAVRKGLWHPKHEDIFVTCSEDSTMRIWKVDDAEKKSMDAVKMKNNQAKNFNKVMTICLNKEGTVLGGAGQDGSIQFWRWNENKSKPYAVKWKAHDTECSSMCFSSDGMFVLTRGMDHALRLWDKRKLTDPIFQQKLLLNEYEFSDCCFMGSNDQFFACSSTAEYPEFLSESTVQKWSEYDLDYFNQQLHTFQTNNPESKDSGRMYIFNKSSLKLDRTIDLSQTKFLQNPNNHQKENEKANYHPIQRFLWDDQMQQLFIGSSNQTLGLYEDQNSKPLESNNVPQEEIQEEISLEDVVSSKETLPEKPQSAATTKGILLGLNRGFKKKRAEDMFETEQVIINPSSMPFFRESDPKLLWKFKKVKEDQETFGSAPLFQTKKARLAEKNKNAHRKATVSQEGKDSIGSEGHGGKLGTNYTQFYLAAAGDSQQKKPDFLLHADPREAILKYAKIAEEEPVFVTPAYQKNQPNPVFQKSKNSSSSNANKRKGGYDDSTEEKFRSTKKRKPNDL